MTTAIAFNRHFLLPSMFPLDDLQAGQIVCYYCDGERVGLIHLPSSDKCAGCSIIYFDISRTSWVCFLRVVSIDTRISCISRPHALHHLSIHIHLPFPRRNQRPLGLKRHKAAVRRRTSHAHAIQSLPPVGGHSTWRASLRVGNSRASSEHLPNAEPVARRGSTFDLASRHH
jgi:hypothetical protein